MDLWTGPSHSVSAVVICEDQLSDDKATSKVWLNPESNLEVDTTKFFDENRTTHHGCMVEPDSCTDQGTECGNECEIPDSSSCSALASLFDLSLSRFEALNKHYGIDCSHTVKSGTTVCMGGTCGDRRLRLY